MEIIMPKFFDKTTKTLFVTQGRTAIADLSENPLTQLPDPAGPPPLALRRQNALVKLHFGRHYISKSGEEFHGNYDLKDPSNADLEEVQDTIYCP